MVSLEAMYQRIRALFLEGILRIDAINSNIATETTLTTINGKITKVDTDNVKVVSEVAYDSATDRKKISIENDSVGLAKESTLADLNSKVTKVNTDATMTIWDYMVKNDQAFVGAEVFTIPNGGSVDVLFANPAGSGKTLKVRRLYVNGEANGLSEVYIGTYGTSGTEDIVKTADGTVIPILNKKNGGTNTSVAVFQYDTSGTKYTVNTSNRTRNLIPGGSGNFATGGEATVGLAGEILEGYAMIIRVLNTSSTDANYGVRIEWWEE